MFVFAQTWAVHASAWIAVHYLIWHLAASIHRKSSSINLQDVIGISVLMGFFTALASFLSERIG